MKRTINKVAVLGSGIMGSGLRVRKHWRSGAFVGHRSKGAQRERAGKGLTLEDKLAKQLVNDALERP